MFSAEFLITSLVVVLIPGAGVIYTVSTGLALKWRASIAAAFGCTLGIIPHLTASTLGLSAILQMSPLAFMIIKYTGALYLLYLAWTMWKETGSLRFDRPDVENNSLSIILKGILINILNPKLVLFFFAFLPQFISPNTIKPANQMLGLSVVFMVMTFVIFVIYGLLASGISAFFVKSPKAVMWVQRSFAVIFALLALDLALINQ